MTSHQTLLTAGLEAALNQYLGLDPDTVTKLAALKGKVIAVELSSLNMSLYLSPGTDGIRIAENLSRAPDVLIRGTPLALARLAQGSESVGTNVEIQGDPHVGKAFRDILATMDIDWEEHLSRLAGDVVAHQLGSLARQTRAWGRQAMNTLLRDTAEYLQEERHALPPKGAVESFLDAVDVLRSDTDRLEARIRRLQQNASRDDR